ncbi:sulfatase-like hydrolase/transferase [Paenibacillus sp. GCM10023248]|uniref:sulfatase-like hydrolase/transferase n=1 Tax=unclassified Paenibacillus TaxID=185978 RepID=UPI002378FE5B|nr:sulfatase-like hydrolase/transferase [Paenibacillus sp. MAHUQ-63]MDD9268617.1 sulfatase-like hydrolase/transferase [Paenibacillus sp. MAHUQ-63]
MGKPNILIFMTDQQQAGVIAPNHPCQMPNVRTLAENGLTFTNVYTTMTHCCPSRASFMTGKYPSQHGIHNNVCNPAALRRGLYPGVTTFSEGLKSAGYQLYYSGKWHISAEENPVDRGWEELFVTAGMDVVMGTTIAGWQEKEYIDQNEPRQQGEIVRPGWGNYKLYGTSTVEYEKTRDYQVVKRAVEQLEKLNEDDTPWCMYVGVTGPHDPFQIPDKYARLYNPTEIPLPPNYYDSLRNKPGIYRRMRKIWDQLSVEEVTESIAYYWGYCTMIDDLLGEVLEALNRTGQADDTLVVFLSDHGENAGAHGLYLKGVSPFEETYRLPCVLRWPNGITQPGREIDALTSIMDFAPTFLDVADARMYIPSDSKGLSLTDWLDGKEPAMWRNALFTQCNGVEVYYMQRIVRTERYKLIYNPTDVDELYDLQEDPYELINMADEPELQEIKRSLWMAMWREAADAGDVIFNQYPTVALAEWGPACAIGKTVQRNLRGVKE